MKKIGVLGGTFDPLHFGHLNMGLSLLEAHGLDEVLFCPARISPFKEVRPPHATPEQRLAMLQLGIQGFKQFKILDWEITNPHISYTIDTIKRLKAEMPAELFLLLGEDQLRDFHLWKDVNELLTLVTPLIAARDTKALSPEFTKIPIMEISSTAIRERLHKKKNCQHLLPHLILDYIQQHHLYF